MIINQTYEKFYLVSTCSKRMEKILKSVLADKITMYNDNESDF